MTIPQRLKAWRQKQKGRDGRPLSQMGAAVLVQATAPAWSDWENGHKVPDLECAVRIEKLVGILVSEWAEVLQGRREAREAAKKAAELLAKGAGKNRKAG